MCLASEMASGESWASERRTMRFIPQKLPSRPKWSRLLLERITLPSSHVPPNQYSCKAFTTSTDNITPDAGEVYTFGKGANGQLGHGNRNDCCQPTKVRKLSKKKIRSIAAGFDQTFCVCSEGRVFSFGKTGPWLGYGAKYCAICYCTAWYQSSDADVRQALMPVPKRVSGLKNIKKISSAAVGQSHTLLLAQTGEVYSIGDNKNGCLGKRSLVSFLSLVSVS